jgi:WD40 repeat protein
MGYSIALDEFGNIYVGGLSGNDSLLMKISRSGDLIWKKVFGSNNVSDFVSSLKITNDGELYAVGFGSFLKFNLDGELLWKNAINVAVKDIIVSKSGEVYISGSGSAIVEGATSIAYGDGFIAKYSSSGQHLWTSALGSEATDEFSSIAFDADENIIATGYIGSGISLTNNQWGALVAKYDSNGELLQSLAFGNSAYVGAHAVAVTKDNQIIIGGRTGSVSLDGSQAAGQSGFIMKLAP